MGLRSRTARFLERQLQELMPGPRAWRPSWEPTVADYDLIDRHGSFGDPAATERRLQDVAHETMHRRGTLGPPPPRATEEQRAALREAQAIRASELAARPVWPARESPWAVDDKRRRTDADA